MRLGGGSFDAYVDLSGGATVGGTIDGGDDGFDAFVWRRSASDAITLDASRTTGFEFYLVQAFGAGTTVSLDGSLDGIGTLYLNGDGAVVNRASGAGGLSTFTPFSSSVLPMRDGPIASFTNEGQVAGGFVGDTSLFVNRGILGSDSLVRRNAVLQSADGALSFNNEGRILSAPTTGRGALPDVFDATRLDIANSGFISGGLSAFADVAGTPGGIFNMANSGTISATGERRRSPDRMARPSIPRSGCSWWPKACRAPSSTRRPAPSARPATVRSRSPRRARRWCSTMRARSAAVRERPVRGWRRGRAWTPPATMPGRSSPSASATTGCGTRARSWAPSTWVPAMTLWRTAARSGATCSCATATTPSSNRRAQCSPALPTAARAPTCWRSTRPAVAASGASSSSTSSG